HRAIRQGYPEVILGQGKTVAQIATLAERIAARGSGFLVTRADPQALAVLRSRFPTIVVNELARTARLAGEPTPSVARGSALVVTAGTSDLPVAEEAAETLAALGCGTDRLTDVGVAGLHRLLARAEALRQARVIIVVAGMDGVLPSVVGGLVAVPVIAVPTSV